MKPRMSSISRLLAMMLCSAALPAFADTYSIDSRHTFPVFEVDHLGFTTQRGRFNKVSGKLELNAAKDAASVDVTIDANSIDMGLDEWNKHMRGERFFNTEKHPALRFVARQFSVSLDKPVAISGELTLLGVTRAVTLSVTKMRCAKHPVLPRELCGADLQTTIKRSEFGMTYGVPGIGDEIRVLIPVEALKDS